MRWIRLNLATEVLLSISVLGASAVYPSTITAESKAVTKVPTPWSGENPAEKPGDTAVVARIGAARFRAREQIGDARYAADGRHIVGCAGSCLYHWDASNGALLRTIETTLAPPDASTIPLPGSEKQLAFAVHPKASRVACGGVKKGKTYLQIWDYATGKLVAEKVSSCDAPKALAWTPDGKRLLERANVGGTMPTAWKLLVRNEMLDEVRSHELPRDFGAGITTVMHPLPGGNEVILWPMGREPTVFDLESGMPNRTLPYKASIPSDLALSPDGKTLAATSTQDLGLLGFPGGETRKKLPVLRAGWTKPRPLFSPDGATLYVWDHRPIAYDVATGTEKWKATFRTAHTVRVQLCDISPDGTTLLARHGHVLTRLDARTGNERDPPDAPAAVADLVWSPDAKTLFTRTVSHDRTWTAWNAASGTRLYDLMPTGFVTDEDWKMLPDLFFLRGGREVVAGLEKSEPRERVGPKELLVFDVATGRCLRRLGAPLPDATFRWMHPIAVDPTGTTVLMQAYAVAAPPAIPGGGGPLNSSQETEYAAVWWDPARQVKVQEWTARGNRTTPPRHFAPYVVTSAAVVPAPSTPDQKVPPARLRCYSVADGRLIHELQTDQANIEIDRIRDNYLLVFGHESRWIRQGNTIRYTPQPPFVYDLWELPSRTKLRLFQMERQVHTILGPGGQYVIRVRDDATSELYEPFVLKRAVTTIATPSRPERFEFSPDGSLVAVAFADASLVVWDATLWRERVDQQIAKDVPADLARLWNDLDKDVATGLRAARLLTAAGNRAVALIGERIEARKPLDEARVRPMITDLDSPVFTVRDKAEKDLRDIGTSAEPYLRKELATGPSPEVKVRIERLLHVIETRRPSDGEIREVRAVQSLKWINTAAARTLLAKWAKGDPSAALTKAAVAAMERTP